MHASLPVSTPQGASECYEEIVGRNRGRRASSGYPTRVHRERARSSETTAQQHTLQDGKREAPKAPFQDVETVYGQTRDVGSAALGYPRFESCR